VNVLHVVVDGELAGGQLVARKLIDGAARRGVRSVVVSPSRGAFTEQLERDSIPVRIAGGFRALRRIVRDERVDIVHTHGMLRSNVVARLAARSAGAAVVWHAHGAPYYPRRARLYRLADTTTARLCARVIAVSEQVRRALVEAGVPARLVEVVHNGYDAPPDAPAPRDGDRRVACIGRIEPAKGQLELVRALADVPGARLVLAGRDVGGHAADVERAARELGVELELLGVREDVLDVIADCAVLALPSHTEGFPIAPLEAMAVRRPVVATAVGGTPELVADGETGLLVPAGDVDALAAAIRRLLDDPQLASELGERGRARLEERFGEDAMVERVVAIWERAS
jgi:glycosyltransferase involved in cell wall biosynthesis